MLAHHRLAGLLGARVDVDHDVGADAQAHAVAHLGGRLIEHDLGRVLELDHHLGDRLGQALAGADVERHPLPTPRIDVKAQRRVGGHVRILGHARLVGVATKLAAHHAVGAQRADGAQHLGLLVADPFAVGAGRRLHGQVADDLEQVILDDVANDAGLLVELAAPLDPEVFRHGDLYVLHVVAVPDRLQKSVGEAKVEDVLDRLLAQVVIDAEDGRLGGREHAGRDGQVMHRAPGARQLGAQGGEGGGVVVVAVDVAQAAGQHIEGGGIDAAAVLGDAGARPLDQLVAVPVRLGNADDGKIQPLAARHAVQGGEDLLVGQIAGGPEEHQRVRTQPLVLCHRRAVSQRARFC